MHRWLGLVAATLLAACGDDSVDLSPAGDTQPPQWSTVCGTEGPHRLLSLRPGEHASRVDLLPDSDRVLVSTFSVDPQIALAEFPPTLDRTIYTVGPCGEDPIEIARGLSLTTRVGALTLACGDGQHGAWVLDPTGAAPPRPILNGWCPLRSTDHGLVTVDADPEQSFGTLVVLRDPADPSATAEPLATGIRTSRNTYFGPGSNFSTSLWAKGERALVLDEQGQVLDVDLRDGLATVELEGVREFRVSSDARQMIWQSVEPSEGDPDTPISPVFLRDRQTQIDTHLLNTHLEWTGNPYVGDYLMVRDDVDGLRVYWADDARPIELPAGTDVRGVLDDGALWLVRRVDGITEELRFGPDEGRDPTVFARHQGSITRRGEGIEIFDSHDIASPSEGSLSFAPFAGGEPTLLADHVHASYRRLADGQILTIVGEDETGHGPLRLVDPETGSFTVLDFHAYVHSPRLNSADPFEGDIVFASSEGTFAPAEGDDADGRAIYRARLPLSE